MFHSGFMRFTFCLPFVSYVVALLLSQLHMPRIVWHGAEMFVIHAVFDGHGSKIANIRNQYNHQHARIRCDGYRIVVASFFFFSPVRVNSNQLRRTAMGKPTRTNHSKGFQQNSACNPLSIFEIKSNFAVKNPCSSPKSCAANWATWLSHRCDDHPRLR